MPMARVNLINPAAEEILFSGPDKTLVHSPLLDDLQTVLQSGEQCTTANWGAMVCC